MACYPFRDADRGSDISDTLPTSALTETPHILQNPPEPPGSRDQQPTPIHEFGHDRDPVTSVTPDCAPSFLPPVTSPPRLSTNNASIRLLPPGPTNTTALPDYGHCMQSAIFWSGLPHRHPRSPPVDQDPISKNSHRLTLLRSPMFRKTYCTLPNPAR